MLLDAPNLFTFGIKIAIFFKPRRKNLVQILKKEGKKCVIYTCLKLQHFSNKKPILLQIKSYKKKYKMEKQIKIKKKKWFFKKG
jgi:hypothetical protein